MKIDLYGEDEAIIKVKDNTYVVKSVYDSVAENPQHNDEGMAPCTVFYRRYFDKDDKYNIRSFRQHVEDKDIVAKKKDVQRLLKMSDYDILDHADSYMDYENPTKDELEETFLDMLDDWRDTEDINELIELYAIFGIEADYISTRSDDILCVAVPDWMKFVGIGKGQAKKAVESALEIMKHWAEGDVFGVVVEKTCGVCDECIDDYPEDCDDVKDEESMWGFYGPDHEKNGLVDAALDLIR